MLQGERVKIGVGEGEGGGVRLGLAVGVDTLLKVVFFPSDTLKGAVEVGAKGVCVAATGVPVPPPSMGVGLGSEVGVTTCETDPVCDSVTLPTEIDTSAEGVS